MQTTMLIGIKYGIQSGRKYLQITYLTKSFNPEYVKNSINSTITKLARKQKRHITIDNIQDFK